MKLSNAVTIVTLTIVAGVFCGGAIGWDRDRIIGPFAGGVNTADDYEGVTDHRPGTWGKSDYAIHKITFHAPAGYRTRILRLDGNFMAGPTMTDPSKTIPLNTYTGVLFGAQTTAPEASVRADFMGDNCLFYIQGYLLEKNTVNLPVNADVHVNGLLEPDGVLVLKTATFLNTTGLPVHMEPSLVITYQFERP